MPKLVLFTACEKPLIGADNSLSLINILHSVKVFPAQEPLPPDAVANSNWFIVALWKKEPDDNGGRFQQRVTITDPTSTVRLQMLTEFEFPKGYHRNISRVQGFPASPVGDYTLQISVRNMKQETWIEAASFPLRVEVHLRESQKPTPSSTTTH